MAVNLNHLTLSEIEAKGLLGELDKKRAAAHKRGRPRKQIDKKQQFSLSYWYSLIVADYKKLRPSQRTRIAIECWKTLINKANSIPADPDQSNINATDALHMLKELENGTVSTAIPGEIKPTSSTDLISSADPIVNVSVKLDK